MSAGRLPTRAQASTRAFGLSDAEAELAHALVHAETRLRSGARPSPAGVRPWETRLTALIEDELHLAGRGDFRCYVRATRLCELFCPLAVAAEGPRVHGAPGEDRKGA